VDSTSVRNLTATPRSIEETGLTLGFLADLALKIIYTRGLLLGYEISAMQSSTNSVRRSTPAGQFSSLATRGTARPRLD